MTSKISNPAKAGLTIALIGLLSCVLILGSGAAAAQDAAANGSEQQTTEIEEQLGQLDIHSVEWIGGSEESDQLAVELVVTWNGDKPTTVNTMEAVDPDSESKNLGIDQTRVLPGERTRIRVDLTSKQTVIVSTEESISEGRAVSLSEGGGGSDRPKVDIMYGVFLGIGIAAVGTFVAGYRQLKSTSAVERSNDSSGGWF